MTLIYCLKCKKKTKTDDEAEIYTIKNRPQLTGLCAKCRTVKFAFTDKEFKIKTRTKEETAETKEKRDRAAIKRKAKKLGFRILDIEKRES